MNEDEMRASGYPKTPDAKLLIPFAINGFVINWIDSKASFCDDYSMQFARDQFLSYVNRYGSGLVLYWFGFIEELNNMQQDGVLLMDKFPLNGIEFLRLPQFNIGPDHGSSVTVQDGVCDDNFDSKEFGFSGVNSDSVEMPKIIHF